MTLVVTGIVSIGLFATTAKGAAALWISAPNWSYSAAAAESPAGWAYFWALSAGAGSFSWAGAYSVDPPFGAAYAFAEASAGGLGGMAAVQVAGLADPYAGVSINIPLTDPSDGGGFPTSKPGTNPFSTPYAVSSTGITFTNQAGSELNGVDGLQAFTYAGGTDEAAIETLLGITSSTSASDSAGVVTDLSMLTTKLGLIPLGSEITDPNNLSSLTFTENNSNVNVDNVILVGVTSAAAPAPTSGALAALLFFGVGAGRLLFRRHRKNVASE